jgi:hypothetical protein
VCGRIATGSETEKRRERPAETNGFRVVDGCNFCGIFNIVINFYFKSRYSSVGIALGYGLDYRGYRVRFPAGTGNFYLHNRVQNGSGAHPASYPMGARGSYPGGKAAGE